jgi:rhodanese-related sulfurtransferase
MLDRQEDVRLLMALGDCAFQAKHIPGSVNFATCREALKSLNKKDKIVVYCYDANCIASKAVGQLLERFGYTHVLHFAGGLEQWKQTGYPLEASGPTCDLSEKACGLGSKKGNEMKAMERLGMISP